jgi:hypothetical protein
MKSKHSFNKNWPDDKFRQYILANWSIHLIMSSSGESSRMRIDRIAMDMGYVRTNSPLRKVQHNDIFRQYGYDSYYPYRDVMMDEGYKRISAHFIRFVIHGKSIFIQGETKETFKKDFCRKMELICMGLNRNKLKEVTG